MKRAQLKRNELTKTEAEAEEPTTNEISVYDVDEAALGELESFVANNTPRTIVGKILRFNKGDYLAGADQDEIDVGTEMVVLVDTATCGWIKWSGDKVVNRIFYPLTEPNKKTRDDLGDTDSSLWELDDDDKPRDPWSEVFEIVMRSADNPEDLYTFSTNSVGGKDAVVKVVGEWVKEIKLRGMTEKFYPKVSLEMEAYNHPNKQYGRIKKPVFKVIGFVPAAGGAKKLGRRAS